MMGLHHSNLARIYAHNEVDGVPYFTMRFIRGRTLGHARIDVRCKQPLPEGSLPRLGEAGPLQLSDDRRAIVVSTPKPARTLVELVRWIDQVGVEITDVQLKRPSLEDVFIELTGKSLRE